MSKAAFKRMMRERAAQRTCAPAPHREAPRPACWRPTDEQLANFVAAAVSAEAAQLFGGDALAPLLTPRMAALMLEANPDAKQGWLRRHREFQEAASGERAERLLP